MHSTLTRTLLLRTPRPCHVHGIANLPDTLIGARRTLFRASLPRRAEPASLYSNFKRHRELPQIERRWPTVLGITAIVLVGWAGFLTYVTNETKVTSSVVKQILRTIKAEAPLQEVLGYAIRPQPEWWLNGYPIIHGQINILQGNIDVSFRLKGSKGSGTVYFTSVRKAKGMPYEILRFRVIADDGQVIEVQTGLEPEEDS